MRRLASIWVGLGLFVGSLCSLWCASLPGHALRPGIVVAWGNIKIPYVPPGTRYQAIATGGGHSLALRSDRTVVAGGVSY